MLLQREGHVVNHKKVLRLYWEEGLAVARRRRKNQVAIARVPLPTPSTRTERRNMDFVSDALADGRSFRCLTIVDDFTRECPAITVGYSLPALAGDPHARSPGHGARRPPVQQCLRQRAGVCEQGARPLGTSMVSPCNSFGRASRSRTPSSRSFNGKFRNEYLSGNWFTSLSDAQVAIEVWRRDSDECRPHSALGRRPPAVFIRMIQAKPAKTPSSDHRLTA